MNALSIGADVPKRDLVIEEYRQHILRVSASVVLPQQDVIIIQNRYSEVMCYDDWFLIPPH